jgi:hypothetical protein
VRGTAIEAHFHWRTARRCDWIGGQTVAMEANGMRKTIILALFLACGSAQAAEWALVSQDIGGATLTYVDKSRVKINGSIRSTWFKQVYKLHSRKFPDVSEYASSLLSLVSFNCDDETESVGPFTIYFEDGTSQELSTPEPFRPVRPDTAGEDEMKYLCNLKP